MNKILAFFLIFVLIIGFTVFPISATEDEELKEIFEVMYKCEALISYFQVGAYDLQLPVSYAIGSGGLIVPDEFSGYVIQIEDTLNSGTYIKANDTWTYEGLKAEMLEVMTQEMALAHMYSTIINVNGEYYVKDNEGIGQGDYSSQFKRIIERTEDTIKIGVYDDPWDEDNWAEYEYIVVKKIDGIWKVVYYDLNNEDWILHYPFSEEYLSYRKERWDPDKLAERTAIAAEEGKKFKQGIEEIPETSDTSIYAYTVSAILSALFISYGIKKKINRA